MRFAMSVCDVHGVLCDCALLVGTPPVRQDRRGRRAEITDLTLATRLVALRWAPLRAAGRKVRRARERQQRRRVVSLTSWGRGAERCPPRRQTLTRWRGAAGGGVGWQGPRQGRCGRKIQSRTGKVRPYVLKRAGCVLERVARRQDRHDQARRQRQRAQVRSALLRDARRLRGLPKLAYPTPKNRTWLFEMRIEL